METEECSEVEGSVKTKLVILSRIISRIRELDLITENEKQSIVAKSTAVEMKAELFDLLSRKDSETVSKILQIVRIYNGAEGAFQEAEENILGNENRNPLKIDLVIKEVFNLLSLNDLKNCRLVCKKWDNIGEPLVRRSSKIVFLRTSQMNRKNTNPVSFNETFRDSQTTVPFNSFSFSSWDGEDGWGISELTDFFAEHGRNVEELEFHNLLLWDLIDRVRIDDYDISPLVAGSPIKKLTVDCFESFNNSPNLMVTLSRLQHVKKLRLKNSNVDVSPDDEGIRRIALSELDLEYVMFYRDDRELDPCPINDYVDVKNTNNVRIHCSAEESAVILDLKDFTDVEEFNLKECTIVNWRIAKCGVNKMKLVDVPLLEKTGMKIKELHFKNSSIDLVALPGEIERLKCSNNSEISCSQPIDLPKLEFLYLKKTTNLLALNHFLNCTLLVDIHIRNIKGEAETSILNLDWLPQSVRRLKLEGDIVVKNGPRRLETLVLEKSTFLNCASVILKILPQVLIMTWYPGYEVNDTAALFRDQYKGIVKFFVGPFTWKKNSFAKSLLAVYVDRESEYYVFENHLGKAIDVNEFNSLNFDF